MKKSQIEHRSVCQVTVNGEKFYPWHRRFPKIEVKFSKSRKTCTLPDGTVLKLAKGRGYWLDSQGDKWIL